MPANNGLSIRHTTRNFPNREGSKPGDGQLSGVVLMDARSIAATARNGGVLTAATDSGLRPARRSASEPFDTRQLYDRRVYFGLAADPSLRQRWCSAPTSPTGPSMPGSGGEPAAAGGLRPPGPRDHHRRAHSLRARPPPTGPTP
ncbi:MAG: hypothetical protein ACLT9P_07505 [Evtepia gabavorous]